MVCYVRAEPSWLWQEQEGLVSNLLLSHGQANLKLKQFAKAYISLQQWYLNDLNCRFCQAPKLLVPWGMLHSRKLMTPHFGPVFLIWGDDHSFGDHCCNIWPSFAFTGEEWEGSGGLR